MESLLLEIFKTWLDTLLSILFSLTLLSLGGWTVQTQRCLPNSVWVCSAISSYNGHYSHMSNAAVFIFLFPFWQRWKKKKKQPFSFRFENNIQPTGTVAHEWVLMLSSAVFLVLHLIFPKKLIEESQLPFGPSFHLMGRWERESFFQYGRSTE